MGMQWYEISSQRCWDLHRRWARLKEGDLFRVYHNFNSYGRFLRVETSRDQRKSAIIILEMDYNVGWSDLADKIIRSLGEPVNPALRKFVTPGKSFTDAANIQKWPVMSSVSFWIGESTGILAVLLSWNLHWPFQLESKSNSHPSVVPEKVEDDGRVARLTAHT